MSVTLYPHQLSNIKSMREAEQPSETLKTRIGVLSDPTGYGKTLSVLGFLASTPSSHHTGDIKVVETADGNEWVSTISTSVYQQSPCNIIIVPAVLLHQWRIELEKTTLNASFISKKRDIDMNPDEYDVIIVIDTLFSLFSMRFSNMYWERCIVDEPQICKRLDVSRLKRSRFTWFITATPHRMIEKTKVFPLSYLDMITIKHTKQELDSYVQIPSVHYHDLRVIEPIHAMCRSVLTSHQYALLKNKNFDALFQSLGYKKMERKSLLDILAKKAEKIAYPFEACISTLDNYSCPICMDKLTEPCATSCCYNFFCKTCIVPLEKTCPLCRRSFDEYPLIDVVYETTPSSTRMVPMTLYDILRRILTNVGDHIIVYSENVHLKHFLRDVATQYALYELDGKPDDKVRTIELFRTTKSILFLTSILHTCGLNLEWTTDVVLCEQLSDSVETQIIGRAQRLGRTNALNVYRIL